MISANITIKAVERRKPKRSPSISAIRIEMAEFVKANIRRTITRIWYPLFFKGIKAFTYSASLYSSLVSNGPLVISSRYRVSIASTPMLLPLKNEDCTRRTISKGKIHGYPPILDSPDSSEFRPPSVPLSIRRKIVSFLESYVSDYSY
jgi:hypothetical protein